MYIHHLVSDELKKKKKKSAQGRVLSFLGPNSNRNNHLWPSVPHFAKQVLFLPPCSCPQHHATACKSVRGAGVPTGIRVELRISSDVRLLKFKAHSSKQRTFSCHWREATIVTTQLTNERDKDIWEQPGNEYFFKTPFAKRVQINECLPSSVWYYS